VVAPAPGRVDHLDQVLKDLDGIFCDPAEGEELQHLSKQSKRIVTKFRNVLKRTQVEQVAALVQAKEWAKATEAMKQNFPLSNIGPIEEVLVFVGNELDSLTSAIKWVGRLNPPVKLKAFQVLYEQFKVNGFTEQPEVLLLWKRIKDLPVGLLDSVRTQLIGDRVKVVERVVEGIKKKDYSLSLKIHEMDESTKKDILLSEIMAEVVGKFAPLSLENTVLLIQYSMQLPRVENCCYLIQALASRSVLVSEQALNIWSHARFTVQEDPRWKQGVRPDVQKLCADVLDHLNKSKFWLFQHYQKYVEDDDKQKIKTLHDQNWHLHSIVSDFVTWYYKNDDLSRVQKLLAAASATQHHLAIARLLSQLYAEMMRFKQTNTFEAFHLFNEVKRHMSLDSYQTQTPEVKNYFDRLKSKAPAFLRLLLWPEEKESQLRLVNKFFDSPLCVRNEKVICCTSEEELLCSATVDPVKVLASLSFESGDAPLTLDALTPKGSAIVVLSETRWRLKPVDEHYVTISTDDGNKLI
jgi:hypothetical protein